jgi:cytochrome bd-type quinol oxidase subunit 1
MNIAGKKVTAKETIIAICCIVVFAVLFYLMMDVFRNEIEKEPVVNFDKEETNPDHIRLTLQITNIDPVKGDVQVRVNPEPEGNYSEDSVTLSRDITIYTNSSSGKNEFVFKKGSKLNPFEITIDMYDGYLMEYPYDKHKAYLNLYIVNPEKDSSGRIEMNEVPIVKETNFLTSIQGYSVSSAEEVESSGGYTGLIINLERTTAVLMFSRFIMILFWLITICVALVIFSIVVRNRKVEYSMFAFLSAMLFALPALRNMQPFIPTIGCLSDYVSFFWAEAIAALALIVMVITWLKRPGPKHS